MSKPHLSYLASQMKTNAEVEHIDIGKGSQSEEPKVPQTSDIIHSKLDKRSYQYMKLDNGIRAMLIHDP